MSKITHIFFDLDDTLLDHTSSARKAAEKLFFSFEEDLSCSEEVFQHRWQEGIDLYFDAYARREINFAEHRRLRIRHVFKETSSLITDKEADRRFQLYVDHYTQTWKLFDDVIPFLDTLSTLPLVIVSNGDYDQKIEKVTQTGIRERFVEIISSSQVGYAKPKKEIFLEACRRVAARPDEVLFIGDSLENDVLGSQNAGMRPIWLDRNHRPETHSHVTRAKNLLEIDLP